MTCPKCEEGKIIKIKFKRSGRLAHMCDFCESLWFVGETIDIFSGHNLSAYSQQDREYSLEESEESDQEHRSVRYTNAK